MTVLVSSATFSIIFIFSLFVCLFVACVFYNRMAQPLIICLYNINVFLLMCYICFSCIGCLHNLIAFPFSKIIITYNQE